MADENGAGEADEQDQVGEQEQQVHAQQPDKGCWRVVT